MRLYENQSKSRVGRDDYDNRRSIEKLEAGVRVHDSITLLNSFSNFATYPFKIISRQVGSSVYVQGVGAITCSSASSGTIAFYMPEGLEPKYRAGFMLAPTNGTNPNDYHVRALIEADGKVRLYWPSAFTIGEALMNGINYLAKE